MAAFAAAVGLVAAGPVQATTFVTFGSQTDGAAAFDATVAAGGDAVVTIAVPTSFGSTPSLALPGGIVLTRNNGNIIFANGVYSSGNAVTSGGTIDISPADYGNGPEESGVTFAFSTPVNAFGFEVGDWGTCCQPSALYISFDDGAPIRVGLSTSYGDVFETSNSPLVFVGGFDDSGSFSKVSFWGDGFGEYLVIGGTLRTANIDFGTIGDGSTFDEPLFPNAIDPLTNRMTFNTTVVPNVQIVIDPDVAIGYDYTFTLNPLELELEDLGDDLYNFYLMSDLANPLFSFDPSDGPIDLSSYDLSIGGGLFGFRIDGIDPSLLLDPANTLAFKTGLKFEVAGPTTITITQTPLTVFHDPRSNVVPEPATWAMMIGGLALVGASMRRRAATARFA